MDAKNRLWQLVYLLIGLFVGFTYGVYTDIINVLCLGIVWTLTMFYFYIRIKSKEDKLKWTTKKN